MEDSYRSGSNNHSLRGHYKGARRYTDRFNKENQGLPGGVLKYFRYAQKTIGNQASWADLATYMNRKTELDICTVGGKKVTFNSSNPYWWFRRLGGKENAPVEKPALTEEIKREHVKWCKKI